MTSNLLPPWATDADVTQAADDIIREYHAFREHCDQQMRASGPRLAAETDAWLEHQTSGW